MDKELINEIQNLTQKLKKENDLVNKDIIRDDVFNVLQGLPNCIVVYYPLDTEANEDGCDGCHVIRTVKGIKKQLVFINTSNTRERQAFSVAHELGHIWNVDGQLAEILKKPVDNVEEVINRFAAELLMPEGIFKEYALEKINDIKGKDLVIKVSDFIKLIVYLMNCFFVPYKAVVLRLVETEIIDQTASKLLLRYKESEYVKSIMCEEQYTRLGIITRNISVPNIVDKIDEIESRGLFSKNKIEAIRKELKLSEMKKDSGMNETVSVNVS